MVKAYLRFEPTGVFGVIASGAVEWDESGKLVYSACLEQIGVFNIKQGSMASEMTPPPSTPLLILLPLSGKDIATIHS